MECVEETKVAAQGQVEAIGQAEGNYLYGVADGGEQTSLGKIGIEGHEVYTIPYQDLCAVVHKCPAQPYTMEDQAVLQQWVITHHHVVHLAWERFGTILPSGFGTIIKSDEGGDPQETVRAWLRQEYESLQKKIERVRGKAEYGVQIFWDPKIIAEMLMEESPHLKTLSEQVKAKPKGAAYLYQQRLERALKVEIEVEAAAYVKDFYQRIKKQVDDLWVEKPKKMDNEKQMLLNLSCLVDRERYKALGEELEKIEQIDGFSVRFTGPWPPYSFVSSG